jgi:tetratricopeptide (TPR) repeat protein
MAELAARGIGIDFGARTWRVVAVEGTRELMCASFPASDAARNLSPEQRRWQPVKRYLGTARLPSDHALDSMRVNSTATDILRWLRRQTETQLGASVVGAAMSLPPFFTDRQSAAAQHCMKAAGFEKAMIVDDTRAAVLAYCNAHKRRGRWLVYGLGGSAFFVSVVDTTNGIAVRAHGGDGLLGGDDLDGLIADHVSRLGYQPGLRGLPIEERAQQAMALLLQAEKWKRALSSQEAVALDEQPRDGGWRLTRGELEDLIRDLVESTVETARQTVAKAALAPGDIDLILLAGGSTHIPLIQDRLHQAFAAPIVHVEEHTIARGAAILATQLQNCFTGGPEASETEPGEISVSTGLPGASLSTGARSDLLRGLSSEWQEALTRVTDWLRQSRLSGDLPSYEEFQRAFAGYAAELYCLHAEELSRSGRLDEAIKCGDEAHRLDPKSERTARSLSVWYAERAEQWRERWKLAEARGNQAQASRFRAECKRDAERSWRLDSKSPRALSILRDPFFTRKSGKRRA